MRSILTILLGLAIGPVLANVVAPVDDGSGTYEFGNSTFTPIGASYSPLFTGSADQVNAFDYPDWTTLPDNVPLRCVGSEAIYSIPEGHTVDWSQHGSLCILNENLLSTGAEITMSAGQEFYFWHQASEPVPSSGELAALSKNSGTLAFDLTLDGGKFYHTCGRLITVTGKLVSKSNTVDQIWFGNYNSALDITGELDFAGSIDLAIAQMGEYLKIRNTGSVTTQLFRIKVGCRAHATYAPQYFLFAPQTSGQTLDIRTLQPVENGTGIYETYTYFRQGAIVMVYSNNTIRTEYLSGAGFHFLADNQLRKTKASPPAANLGVGSIDVTSECNVSDDGPLYLSTNINFRAAKVTNAVRFDFTSEEDGVNARELEITGSCNDSAKAVATSPAMLPRTLSGFTGTIDLATNGNSAWSFPFDFSQDDPCPSGCEGSGTLSVPASGTIEITIPAGSGAAKPISGTYPLMTCSTGGSALSAADWPVSINGVTADESVVSGFMCSITRGDTGLSLAIKEHKGLVVILN